MSDLNILVKKKLKEYFYKKEEKKEIPFKYYTLDNILTYDCRYNWIYGERSNGKTYAVKKYILDQYFESGKQAGIIRRWDEDIKGASGAAMFSDIESSYPLHKYGWKGIAYKNRAFWLYKISDDEKEQKIYDNKPFCYTFALTKAEHYKSLSYPNIKTLLFDEAISRDGYLGNEWDAFQSVCATIIRLNDDVKIFMLGNTVSKDCIYFEEMFINIYDINKGDIKTITYEGEDEPKVAVEYCNTGVQNGGKKSDVYFKFGNNSNNMIVNGNWETANYPHCPIYYKTKHIKFTFYIRWKTFIFQCDIINYDMNDFIFIHQINELSEDIENNSLIYSEAPIQKVNYFRRINETSNKISTKIWRYFQKDKVYYQNNTVGEYIRSYLIWCRDYNIIK